MDQATREKVLVLMQKDIEEAGKLMPEWLNEPCAEDDTREYTPLQILDEVKNGTDFGNRYGEKWLLRHNLLETMDNLVGLLSGTDIQTNSPGSTGNDKSN
jgi:hypothetical protein